MQSTHWQLEDNVSDRLYAPAVNGYTELYVAMLTISNSL